MSKFVDWLLNRKPAALPDPFDDDVVDAHLDGTAFNPASGRNNRRKFSTDLEPPAREAVPFESDPTQAQYFEEQKAKRGKPFAEWKDGEDYRLTDFYAAVGQDWVNAPPLAEHYNPAMSKSRKARSEEWRSTENKGNYQPTDQPLGGGIQVVVDMSTKHTYYYCQKGHVHQYNNDQLANLTRYTKKVSKHFPGEQYFTSNVDGLYYKPLTDEIRNVPDCD